MALWGCVLGLACAPAETADRERATDRVTLDPGEVTAILEALRTRFDVPGLAVVVADQDGILGSGAVGLARVDATLPLDQTNRFHIGSVSKPITSSAIGALVEAGVLRWDARVLDVLQGMRADVRPEYAGITLRQLLAHTAGIPPFEEDSAFAQFPPVAGDARARRLGFARWLLTLPPVAPPGSAHVYSNAGYAIAAAMAERAADEPFELIVRRTVFRPLGLTSAGAGPPAAVSPDEPWGHSWSGDRWRSHGPPYDQPFADLIRPAGDFHMSLLDLTTFGLAHLRGLEGVDGFLKAQTIREIHVPVMEEYGLGWNVRETHDSHLGGLEEMHTVLLLIHKAEGRVYALAANAVLEDVSVFSRAIAELRTLLNAGSDR